MRIAITHWTYLRLRLPGITAFCFFFAFPRTNGTAQITTITTRCNVTAKAAPDVILCRGNSIALNGTATGTAATTTAAAVSSNVHSTAFAAACTTLTGTYYTWIPVATISGGANTLSPTAAPAASTNYFLSITASNCLAKDTAPVSILNLSSNVFDTVMTLINVDADPDNNCTASGGTGLTELISQTGSGSSPVAAVTALYSDSVSPAFPSAGFTDQNNAYRYRPNCPVIIL